VTHPHHHHHPLPFTTTRSCYSRSRLREFENLQSECESVADLFKNVSELVVEQAPMVDKIEENVEVAQIHVEEGTKQLQLALSYKKTMYPLLGGLVGACMLVSRENLC
jgi:syntaxin 17